MHTVLVFHVVAVIPALFDQVTAVGCCIDQDIIRTGLHASFDDCLQEFVFNLEVFERKVIHVNDKAVVPVFYLCNDGGQILELMLVNLDHTKSLIIIFVEQCFDAGRLSGTGISTEQYVVGRKSFDKCLCIINQLFLLDLISDQIFQKNAVRIVDRQEFHSIFQVADTESAVQTEHTNAVCFVEIRNDGENLIGIFGLLDFLADFLHTFTDIAVVHPFLFRNRVVIADRRETVDTKIFFNGTKVKVKQFFEYGEICFCKMIDGTVIGTYLLTGHAERVFIGQQDEGQIIVPQIFVEAILGGKIEERFHLLIDPAGQSFFFCEIKFIVAEDAGQL